MGVIYRIGGGAVAPARAVVLCVGGCPFVRCSVFLVNHPPSPAPRAVHGDIFRSEVRKRDRRLGFGI